MALLFTTATVAAAQSAGTFEITGFGRYTRYADTLALQEGASGGASLGFYPVRNLAIEGEAAYSETHSNLGGAPIFNIPLRARLTYHIPIGGYASALRIGAGYLQNLYIKSVSFEDRGFTGVLGFRWGLSPTLGFRIDGIADYVKSPEADRADEYLNWGAQVGLSLKVGAAPAGPKDRDKDGVLDRMDSCPKTTAGKTVDRNGCAAHQKDADRDAVNDELDRCPDTGAGEPVDPEGCSASQKDDDKDGILNSVDQCPNTPWGENANSSGCAGNQRDEDRDGVSDAIDQCPNTPTGEPVNSRGCFTERDSDGDNVPDKRDRCPDTPQGAQADSNGCLILVNERDSDGDNVPDKRDQCPDTPMGTPANANGCPILVNERDSDGDNVPDKRDQCPDTPPGARADANGCPILLDERDSDGDSVPDKRDQCPDTPQGTPANANGCPIPLVNDSDTDGDGVPDRRDRCPDTPKGEAADATGCTIAAIDERDTDGDGVPDRRDRCPETPKTETADAKGCTILFHKGVRSVILRGVTFASGRAMLTPQGREILREVAIQLVENPQYRVQISGHTDNVGSRAGNLRLSLARARTVETFLVANGVPHTQVTAKGFGPDVPIAPNTTAAGQAKNRRVELNRTN
jgi:outer membrane protein OmpA-like peptidoglycan-associated protein